MKQINRPWHLLLVAVAGWANREQRRQIEFLLATIEVLKEHNGKKRILLSDDQRRRLAVKAKVLTRKLLTEVSPLFSADTIPRWHRELVARMWDHSDKRKKPGRPTISDENNALVLRIARENPTWGYDRIVGALENLGHSGADESVGNMLLEHGIEPAHKRCRQATWRTFLKSHWDVLAAIDFTTIEIWTGHGLNSFYLLFAMQLKTRRVAFAGCTVSPDTAWMKQIARNLTYSEDGFLINNKCV